MRNLACLAFAILGLVSSLLYSSVAGLLRGAIPLFAFHAVFSFLGWEPLNAYPATGALVGASASC